MKPFTVNLALKVICGAAPAGPVAAVSFVVVVVLVVEVVFSDAGELVVVTSLVFFLNTHLFPKISAPALRAS